MKYLIYMSTSVRLFNDAELKQLLRTSQANNAVNKLTGMLLYSEGTFVQVLEGEAEVLDKIYAEIQHDSRHKNIIKLAEGNLDERIFPFWSMGFKTLSADDLSVFDAYIDPHEKELWGKDDFHPAITILKTFAESNNL